MPIEILMPALSPTMTEGNLIKWNKKEGDQVLAGDVIAEIETDKATMEIEAIDEGKLVKIIVPAGTENVKVNQLIAVILEEGEDASALKNFLAEDKSLAENKIAAPSLKPDLKIVTTQNHEKSPRVTSERIFATPLARRIAEQQQLDLTTIKGSGPHGRITKKDVENTSSPTSKAHNISSPGLSGYEPSFKTIKTSNVRRIIAQRLTEAKQTVPHFYLTVDCEIDRLLEARAALNAEGEGQYKISVNDFVILACALALKKVPEANASWIDGNVYQYETADVAVAVAIDDGLITPVIRQTEQKSLVEISATMKGLASRAREGKLKPEEFQGGTFTLSNLGMYGIKEFSAIINPPQGCILAVGMGEQRPVAKNGSLEIATVMSCTLSVDHRVVDGAVGANFLKAFKGFITNPITMFA